MDYAKFRVDNDIERKDMISAVKEYCPKYSKIQQSMVEAPDKYGMCLLPSLDDMLIKRFGGKQAKPSKQKKPVHRTKSHRFQVWLDDETAEKLIAIRARDGLTTQQLLQELVENLIALSEAE